MLSAEVFRRCFLGGKNVSCECTFWRVIAWFKRGGVLQTIEEVVGALLNRLTFGEWGLAELASFHIICQPAVFIRRAALERAGYLDPDYHFMLDHHLWIRIAQQSPIKYAGGRDSGLWAAARHHALAKNVSQAEAFSVEILRLLAWVQELPDLAPEIKANHKHIRGGAYRLNARYLLDGGLYEAALRSYVRALFAWPSYALKHWHRTLYTIIQAAGLGRLINSVDHRRRTHSLRQSDQLASTLRAELQRTLDQLPPPDPRDSLPYPATVDDWPGLCLQ